MRICLFWNEGAGEGVSLDELRALVAAGGHRIERVIERDADLPRAPDGLIDCVVAAGGDGTVARAGRALAGSGVPLAILPLGTANNIAASLGITSAPEDVIAAWKDQRVVKIDVGVARDVSGETRFLESVGSGLVTAAITASRQAVPQHEDVSTQLDRARQLYVDMVKGLQPRHYAITIDGTAIEGDYLLVEVLNIPSIGPNVRLTADVNAADGLLSVVAAGEADRDALVAYLQTRLNGEPADAGLKSWRASRIELRGAPEFHVDDEVRDARGGVMSIEIRSGDLAVLA
jgi:diacylglycerol kinase (ATP)